MPSGPPEKLSTHQLLTEYLRRVLEGPPLLELKTFQRNWENRNNALAAEIDRRIPIPVARDTYRMPDGRAYTFDSRVRDLEWTCCGHPHTKRYCGAEVPRDDGAGPDTCICDDPKAEPRPTKVECSCGALSCDICHPMPR